MKSKKTGSEHFKALWRVFVLGTFSLPRELGTTIGEPFGEKKRCLRVESSRTSSGGTPHISIMYAS